MKVLISGGGPAGATAAYWLASQGVEVTVLSEAQPEEPTWAGAKVLAGVHRFLRGGKGIKPWRGVYSDGVVGDFPLSWSDVCSRGPVLIHSSMLSHSKMRFMAAASACPQK